MNEEWERGQEQEACVAGTSWSPSPVTNGSSTEGVLLFLALSLSIYVCFSLSLSTSLPPGCSPHDPWAATSCLHVPSYLRRGHPGPATPTASRR